jgi:hypothetical protein
MISGDVVLSDRSTRVPVTSVSMCRGAVLEGCGRTVRGDLMVLRSIVRVERSRLGNQLNCPRLRGFCDGSDGPESVIPGAGTSSVWSGDMSIVVGKDDLLSRWPVSLDILGWRWF